jgi:hypothetical protein
MHAMLELASFDLTCAHQWVHASEWLSPGLSLTHSHIYMFDLTLFRLILWAPVGSCACCS